MARVKAFLDRLVKLSLDPMELVDDSAVYAKLRDLASRPVEASVELSQVFVRALEANGGVNLVVRGWSLQPAIAMALSKEEALKLLEELAKLLGKRLS